MKRIRGKLTYANVVATISLFLAVGGASAMAASQLAKNSVGAKQLKSNAITAAKIKTGAVTSPKVAAVPRLSNALAPLLSHRLLGNSGKSWPLQATAGKPKSLCAAGVFSSRANSSSARSA